MFNNKISWNKYYLLGLFFLLVILTLQREVSAQVTYLRLGVDDRLIYSSRDEFRSKLNSKDNSLIYIANTFVISKNDTFSIISPAERATSLFIISNFDQLLLDIRQGLDFHYLLHKRAFEAKYYKPFFNGHLSAVHFSTDFGFFRQLNSEKESIFNKIRQSNLSPDDKDVLLLYLRSILAYSDLMGFDGAQMSADLSRFMENYPSSLYVPFVEGVLYVKLETSPWGFGCGISSGAYILQGNISRYFTGYIPLAANFEFGFKKLILKTTISAALNSHIRESFDYKEKNWPADSLVDVYYNLSGNVGYIVLDKTRIRITPFVGVGTQGIELYDYSKISFKANLNYAVDFDWKFAYSKSFAGYYEALNNGKEKTYFPMRLRLGYSKVNSSDFRFQGSQFYALIEFGFFMNPSKRVKARG